MRNVAKRAFCPGLIVFLAAMLALVSGVAIAQNRQQPQVKPPTPSGGETSTIPSILVAPDEDYRIGSRDVIEIKVEDAPELSSTYQVNADGTFLMPYLRRVVAKDKTPEELSRFIGDGLRGRYLKDPQVLITVKQFYSRTFFIQGAVRRPGVYQMEGHPSLLKLITVAGGLAENHGSTAFIIREVKKKPSDASASGSDSKPEPRPTTVAAQKPGERSAEPAVDDIEYTLKTVKISGLFIGNFDQNMYVEPGDIVNIPISDVFFVAGEVNAPGSFPLTDGTTLRQAIALSQGMTFNAASGRGVIFRQDRATGQRLELPVDVGAVMKGQGEDITIIANDIIIVPNSKMKTVGNAVLKAMGMGVAQRGVYRY